MKGLLQKDVKKDEVVRIKKIDMQRERMKMLRRARGD